MDYTTTVLNTEPIIVTIGNFDGIHRGHQYLMHELSNLADSLHCTPVMITFAPHTLMVVRPDISVHFLTTLDEKLALAATYGHVSQSIVIHFTPEIAAMTAQDFMDTLCSKFAIRGLLVGDNFSLGHKRMGDIVFLHDYGEKHGLTVRSLPLQEFDDQRISSTRIRSLVAEGSIQEANELLGHPFRVNGVVAHGNERGRLLGFPTANLSLDPYKLLPGDGVYAVRTRVLPSQVSDSASDSTVYNGVTNIGVRPTFNGTEHLVEVHLLDVSLDLYGRSLSVDFIARLRGEQRFAGVEALKSQIASDAEKARQILTI